MKEGECGDCRKWKPIKRCEHCSRYYCDDCVHGNGNIPYAPNGLLKCEECHWHVCWRCYVVKHGICNLCYEGR